MASNYTENYGLCQWEAGDSFVRTEFNQDNARLDEALNQLAVGLAGKAEQSDLAQAVSTLTQAVAGAEEASPLKRLAALTLDRAAAQAELDVSRIALTEYHELLLYLEPGAGTTADRIELHLNSLTAYYGPNNTYTALAVTELGSDPGRTFCRFRLTLGGWVTGCCSSSYRTSSQHWSLDTDRRMAELRDSQLETIRVTADEGNLGAGTVLRLYGVKK